MASTPGKNVNQRRLSRKKQIGFLALCVFFSFVFFSDYLVEMRLMSSNNTAGSKNLSTMETSIPPNSDQQSSESELNEQGDYEQLLEAIEEVIENVEDQIVSENEKAMKEENEKVDDEELLEAIEEVIENIEDQVQTESDEKRDQEENDSNNAVGDSTRNEKKTTTELFDKLRTAKSNIEARVRQDYGGYFAPFFAEEALKEIVGISDTSMERLITLLHSKILSAQLTDEKTTFVWTTGGHSSAAGHGNLFSQSYTAILEDTVKEVFDSLDIEFIGRNHAMGGYKSAPELSCCINSIYGKDTDVLSWDFGMTDGRDPMNMVLWSHRAALLRDEGLPFMFYMSGPNEQYTDLEVNGFGTGWKNNKVLHEQIMKLPDFEKASPGEIDSIPDAIKYFRCGEGVEGKGTICNDFKWNTSVCEHAKFQVSWHPGWKSHMMSGRMVGFFLIYALVDAMEKLESAESKPLNGGDEGEVASGMTSDYLDYLLAQRKISKDAFFEGPVPDKVFGEKEEFTHHGISNDILYRSESICHTALLPSLSKPDDFDPISKNDIPQPENDTDSIPLYSVIDTTDIQECETTLNIDHKNYYLARSEDPVTKIRLPSGTEVKSSSDVYLPDRLGVIMVCQPTCPWGKCTEGLIQLLTLQSNSTHIELTVNGERVEGARKISDFCYVLVNSNGDNNWGKSKQYDLTILVNEPKSVFELSSIVVF